jgi:mycothiol synthase
MTASLSLERLRLPAGFEIRHISAADAEIATDLVRLVDIAACGETTTTLAELISDIDISNEHGPGSFGVFQNDILVQYLNIHDDLADAGGWFLDLFIHPEMPKSEMLDIAVELIGEVELYARQTLENSDKESDFLKTSLYENDEIFLKALAISDFESHRKYWRLRIDHNDSTGISQMAKLPQADIEIRGFSESEANFLWMHQLSNEIFADHYDFNPMNFERWKYEFASGVNNPALWRVAYIGDKPVGYSWGSERFTSEGFGYVASLGVLREFRSLGIAKALLNDAFERDATAGLQGTLLHCDATNPTGATRLYESAGMRVDRIYVAYRKPVSRLNA